MGKLTAFNVQFPNNPPAVFHPGDTANGQVFVKLNSPMNIKAVRIRFRGEAYVHFTEKIKYKYKSTTRRVSAVTGQTLGTSTITYTRTKTLHRKARETYYDKTFVLYGKGSGGVTEKANEISAGENLFQFALNLRENLPSSFEGKYGHVRYSLKATLVKPWKFNESTKIAFTVLDMVDLNIIPKLNLPVEKSFTKTLCCCCCANGPIEVTIQLNKTGFVPGEYIAITGSIANFSSKEIQNTKAYIIQQVIYYAEGRRKLVQNKVAKVKGPGCPREGNIAVNKLLRVPPLPPTMTRHCKIIEVEYFLRFIGKMPFLYRNLQATFAITIGSVPLQLPAQNTIAIVQNVPVEIVQPPALPLQATAPPLPAPEPQPTLVPSAPFFPSPTFQESAGGAVSIRDANDRGDHLVGNAAFAPQYTFYNCSPPAMLESEKIPTST